MNKRILKRVIRKASLLAAGSLLVLAAAFTNASSAQDYPTKPIKMVVPYAPGGATDIVARLFANALGQRLGKQVLVENRAGGGGGIGVQSVLRSPPDGYTLLITPLGPLVLNTHLQTVDYNPMELVPITRFFNAAFGLAVAKDVPVNNLKEFIAWAQAQPKPLHYGMSVVGAHQHLTMELLAKTTGLAMQGIPYGGSGPSVNALVTGEVKVAVGDMGPMISQSEKIKLLAVTSAERLQSTPNIPTLSESGLPGFAAESWAGLFAPPGTPDSIVSFLERQTVAVLEVEEVKKAFIASGVEAQPLNPQAFKKLIAEDDVKWRTVIKDAGIKLQ